MKKMEVDRDKLDKVVDMIVKVIEGGFGSDVEVCDCPKCLKIREAMIFPYAALISAQGELEKMGAEHMALLASSLSTAVAMICRDDSIGIATAIGELGKASEILRVESLAAVTRSVANGLMSDFLDSVHVAHVPVEEPSGYKH